MKAIVDTTILTDVSLKTDAQRDRALVALASYEETLLPTYAIKEFKAGPLHYYVWLHNKVVEANSLKEVVAAIKGNIGFKKNLPATALQAIEDFLDSIANQIPAALGVKYPGHAMGQVQLTELRIWLRQRITRAWRSRRRHFTAVIAPLSCYVQQDHLLKPSGQLDDSPLWCKVADCCQRVKFKKRLADLELLEQACSGTKREVVRRRQALKRLRKHPNADYEEKHCRLLGDAIFALECRQGAEILTTNVVDHAPLASALGFSVRRP